MMWDLQRVKTLRTQIRNFIRFYKTYDAGCCKHQGVEHRGYRIVLWDTYALEASLWGTRELCRLCGKLELMENMWRGRPVAPANKKEKQGVPPPMKSKPVFPSNLIIKENGSVVKKF